MGDGSRLRLSNAGTKRRPLHGAKFTDDMKEMRWRVDIVLHLRAAPWP
jgi:hypothetical protein